MISGLLLLNKPSGVTSHDCVSQVRRLLKQREVGHVGTLDPRAKGLLPLCVGVATKLSNYLQAEQKRYHFQIRLGLTTNTQDMDGEIIQEMPVPEFSQTVLDQMCQAFIRGPYEQETPDYSARKVNGKKLYEYARSGEEVPRLPPRLVKIEQMLLKKVNEETLEGEVLCSTGTYVRQMAVDIAQRLGTVGVLFDLVRTGVGPWALEQSTTVTNLESELVLNPFLVDRPYFVSLNQLMDEFPRYEMSTGLWQQVRNGVQPIYLSLGDLQQPSATRGWSGLSQGDLICGMVRRNTETWPGALFSVNLVKDQMVSCKLQKLLHH